MLAAALAVASSMIPGTRPSCGASRAGWPGRRTGARPGTPGAERFHSPGVDPGRELRGAAQVLVQGGLVDDGARATFTRTAVGFIRLSSRAPISPGGAVNSSAKLPATGADSG